MYEVIRTSDPAVFQALELEVQRQRHHLELIASENYASRAVMQAMGSHFTNKYAEGYPGRRYYGGCAKWTSSRTSPATAPSSSSAPSTPTCSPTAAPRPTWRSTSPP